MKNKRSLFSSFQTKVTLFFVLSLLFLAALSNFFLYEYSLSLQFKETRDKLMAIARTAALSVNTDLLLRIPLNRSGINSADFKVIARQLESVKQANPLLKYIYTMAKTFQPGILQFIVDPSATEKNINPKSPTAFPGDTYDAQRFPEMLKAFESPSADKKMSVDAWGVTLSGYAPIYNNAGEPVAILGVDVDASNIYAMQKTVATRAVFILLIGVILSLALGVLVSKRVTGPVGQLLEGTRKIAAGDLEYKVQVKGKDEISELALSFNNMASRLAEARKDLEDYFYRVVQSMVRSLEAKDPYTRGHSDRVSEYTEKIALEMGVPYAKTQLLKKVAQLHDIGKLGIRENILNKEDTLSSAEWDAMHMHPIIGEEILRPVFSDEEMLSVVRCHHERYDGKGYPYALKGEEISILSQIVSVADTYDAMTSSRAYRPALSKEEAVETIKKNSGAQFNPRVVEAFFRLKTKDAF